MKMNNQNTKTRQKSRSDRPRASEQHSYTHTVAASAVRSEGGRLGSSDSPIPLVNTASAPYRQPRWKQASGTQESARAAARSEEEEEVEEEDEEGRKACITCPTTRLELQGEWHAVRGVSKTVGRTLEHKTQDADR